MAKYGNLGGNSNIVAYELGDTFIDVRFADNSTYRYANDRAGGHNVDKMRVLALAGRGLNAFINTQVKYLYSSKW